MIPVKSFYLIRHGESEANLAGITAGGGVDSPLTKRGEEQARQLADFIHYLNIKPSCIFASPMKRAHKTAEIINRNLKLDISVVDNLYEHHVGDWEGRPWAEIGPKFRAGELPPNGESYETYAYRVRDALSPILSSEYATPPLIVAHGGTFYSLGHLFGWKISDIKNCHLHRFIPHTSEAAFPFQVFEYNISEENLVEAQSGFCALFGR